jgi:hypothetical protein
MATDLGVLGHHIASEAIERMKRDKSLGAPSTYNIIREAAIDILAKETDLDA